MLQLLESFSISRSATTKSNVILADNCYDTLDNQGAIIFLDYRYSISYCRSFLPTWITEGMKTLPNEKGVLAREISSFFKI